MNSMIQTVDLTKKFNDFVANDHINLDVKEQEGLSNWFILCYKVL